MQQTNELYREIDSQRKLIKIISGRQNELQYKLQKSQVCLGKEKCKNKENKELIHKLNKRIENLNEALDAERNQNSNNMTLIDKLQTDIKELNGIIEGLNADKKDLQENLNNCQQKKKLFSNKKH